LLSPIRVFRAACPVQVSRGELSGLRAAVSSRAEVALPARQSTGPSACRLWVQLYSIGWHFQGCRPRIWENLGRSQKGWCSRIATGASDHPVAIGLLRQYDGRGQFLSFVRQFHAFLSLGGMWAGDVPAGWADSGRGKGKGAGEEGRSVPAARAGASAERK